MGCKSCSSCSGCSSKENYERTEKQKDILNKKLNKIKEEVNNLDEMINSNKECEFLLEKIQDLNKSLKLLGNSVLEEYVNNQVITDVQMGEYESIEDLMLLIKKLQ